MNSDRVDQRAVKRQSRLLPAPNAAAASPSTHAKLPTTNGPVFDDSQVFPKRPRIGVVVACDRCRLKKIRCDGGRPTCRACARKGLSECHYDEPSAKNPNAGYLLEGVRILTSMPPAQTAAALLAVADLDKDTEIIAALRDMASSPTRQTAYITGPSTGFTRFLERKHPYAYPINAPTDPSEPRKSLSELIQPKLEAHRYNENIPTETAEENDVDAPSIADVEWGASNSFKTPRDDPLHGLDISRWTTVSVSDIFAAKAISWYLERDHLLLGLFDRKLFLKSLLSPRPDSYCSPCLVNALMYWCCQSLAATDREAVDKAEHFRIEAMRLMGIVPQPATALKMAAEVFLSLGNLVQGREAMALSHLFNATTIGMNLRLYGVPEDVGWAALSRQTPEEVQDNMYPTWGAFNWIVLMNLFYRHQEVTFPQTPPVMPIPFSPSGFSEDANEFQDDMVESNNERPDNIPGQEQMFTSLCRFWQIHHEVISVYYENRSTAVPGSVSLQFAEFKYRELLAWADELPPALSRSDDNPEIVVILHILLHSAILDIFCPFLQNDMTFNSKQRLKTFPSADATPDDAYDASMDQLKQLILNCKLGTTSEYNIVWQAALLYAASGMLRSRDEDRLEYFLICLYGCRTARHSFHVTVSIAQGILSAAMQQGVISGTLASMIMADLRARAPAGEEAGERAVLQTPSLADLDSVMTDPGLMTAEQLAGQFDDSLWISKYTSLFSEGSPT